MECFLPQNCEDEGTQLLVTTPFVKEEPGFITEERCYGREQISPCDLYSAVVKDEPVVSNVIVDVEVTCLTDRPIKEEFVAVFGESNTTGNNHIIMSNGDQFEVCITKESCSSPSVNGSIFTDEEPQEYQISQKILKTESYLTSHNKTGIKKKTSNNEENTVCKVCEQQFPTLSTYLKHRQNHLLEKPYSCEICEKQFNSKYLLSNHERTHTGEKPFACDVCDKRFSEQVNLNRHKRTHSGAKPHQCDVCKKTFSLKHNLKLHIRCHTKERPFECETCKTRFPHPSDLKRHQRSHTGEKRFSCDICKKSFARKHYLPLHIQSHDYKKLLKRHRTKKCFTCHICKDSFIKKRQLTKHLHQNHGKTSK